MHCPVSESKRNATPIPLPPHPIFKGGGDAIARHQKRILPRRFDAFGNLRFLGPPTQSLSARHSTTPR